MNRLLTATIALTLPLVTMADEVPGITISKTDGSNISLPTNELRSIKFKEGSMIVNMKDDSQQLFSVGDIANITFGDIITAINTITNDQPDTPITITDLSGRIIYKGNASNTQHLTPNTQQTGTFIINANGKSRTVIIKK